MTSSLIEPTQLDWQVRPIVNPIYKLVKVPINNLTTAGLTATAAGQQTIEFKLPTQVYNLSRSFLQWNETFPAQAAYSWSHEDVFSLGTSITLGQSAGVNLVDLQFAGNFSKVARKLRTPIADYMKHSDMSGLYKCNTPAALPKILTNGDPAAAAPADRLIAIADGNDPNTGNVVPGGVNGAYSAFDGFIEPRYSLRSTFGQPMYRNRQYPLGAFKGTLLGVDRDFYSPTEMYLRIVAGSSDKMGFAGTSSVNPSTGAATVASGVVVSNCYLFLAVETNAPIIAKIMNSYQSGTLNFQIPYTTAFKNIGAAANAITNIQIQISQQYGKKLKRILHTVWHPTELYNTAYDCQNYNGAKIVSYQTFMDNLPQQDRILSCLRPATTNINMDDWLENRRFLEESVITSKEVYQLNWFHQDQFFASLKRDDRRNVAEQNIDEGLPMSAPHQWLFSGTAGATASLVHYTFVEFARDVTVTPSGPAFV